MIDCGEGVGAVLIYLSKAFDTIDHGPLLNKLAAYGISNEEHRCFSNYLIDRMQRVSSTFHFEMYISILKRIRLGSTNLQTQKDQREIKECLHI